MSRSHIWIALLGSVASRDAHASPVQYESDVCDQAMLEHRLEELGVTGAFDDPADPVVRIAVTAGGGRMIASISLVEDPRAAAARVVEETDCDRLADALAIVVAVALAERPPALVPAPPAPLPPPPVPTIAPPSSERWLVVGGEMSVDNAIGFVAGARLRKGWKSIGLELEPYTWHALDQVGNAMHAPAQISLALTAARIVPCAHDGSVAACLLISGGALRVQPDGLSPDRGVLTSFAAIGLRATWEHRLSERLWFELHADARASLLRTQLVIDGMSTWTAPAVDIVVGCAVSARFP